MALSGLSPMVPTSFSLVDRFLALYTLRMKLFCCESLKPKQTKQYYYTNIGEVKLNRLDISIESLGSMKFEILWPLTFSQPLETRPTERHPRGVSVVPTISWPALSHPHTTERFRISFCTRSIRQ